MPLHRQVDVCTHIVSDRLYLIDNLLCLLSNAVKYSDRGATIEVIIEITAEETIMNPTVTPVINAAGAVNLAIQSYDAGIQNSGISKPSSFKGVLEGPPTSPKGRKVSPDLSRPGSLNGAFEIYSIAKACSKEIQAFWGIPGIPNPNLDSLKNEMSARLLLEEPLAEMVRPAMLVVRVVDSGIGLSGIT